MPTISVIMGIYNTKCREYLEKSLNSILNQTYSDFELIVCDDGSTNDCMQWAKEICKDDDRVIFLKNDKNMGLAYTLNKCLSKSKGEYIARMDDDDVSRLDRFEKQIIYLRKNNVDLVSSNINVFDENGRYGLFKYPEIISKEDFLFNSPIVHPSVLGKRKCFELVGGYSEDKTAVRVEDYDLFMRMYAAGVTIRVVQEELLDYRRNGANIARRRKVKYRINECVIRAKDFKLLKMPSKRIIYVIKPIVACLIPVRLTRVIEANRLRKGE